MPTHTANSRGKFQQHRNRIDDLIRENLLQNQAATAAGDAAAVEQLGTNLAELFRQKTELFQAELMQYPLSGLPPSQAEARLAASAEDARRIAKRARGLTRLIDATSRMADLVTRLMTALV